MNAVAKDKKYKPEIDGLRAIAVIAVIINHFNKDLLPSGYLGVDIFFVISGFVVTLSFLKSGEKFSSRKSLISNFFKKSYNLINIFFIAFGNKLCSGKK